MVAPCLSRADPIIAPTIGLQRHTHHSYSSSDLEGDEGAKGVTRQLVAITCSVFLPCASWTLIEKMTEQLRDIKSKKDVPQTDTVYMGVVQHAISLPGSLLVHAPVSTYSGAVYPRVPTTLVDTWVCPSAGPSFARPKSESLGKKFC